MTLKSRISTCKETSLSSTGAERDVAIDGDEFGAVGHDLEDKTLGVKKSNRRFHPENELFKIK